MPYEYGQKPQKTDKTSCGIIIITVFSVGLTVIAMGADYAKLVYPDDPLISTVEEFTDTVSLSALPCFNTSAAEVIEVDTLNYSYRTHDVSVNVSGCDV